MGDVLCEQLRRVFGLVVRDGIGRARHRDDDDAVLHLDLQEIWAVGHLLTEAGEPLQAPIEAMPIAVVSFAEEKCADGDDDQEKD